jgi:hypothetical protein
MSLVFLDSFNGYNQLLLKWSSGLANFNTLPQYVRTGTQSLNPTGGAFTSVPRINFQNRKTVYVGIAYYQTADVGNGLYFFFNSGADAQYCTLAVSNDGSLVIQDSVVPASRPGIIDAGQWYYIEVGATFASAADGGGVTVRVNAEPVIVYTGDFWDGAHSGVDGFLLPGSAVNNCYFNDLYINDGTGGVNDYFWGPVQIFAILPDANESPLNFAPLANTNYQEVNQAPPPGDTAYVYDQNSGAVDQYHYTPGGPSGPYIITGLQHSLCCRLDASGAHTVASQINGNTGAGPNVGSAAIGNTYAYVIQPWDLNPNTGNPFAPADFATTWFGPKITS